MIFTPSSTAEKNQRRDEETAKKRINFDHAFYQRHHHYDDTAELN